MRGMCDGHEPPVDQEFATGISRTHFAGGTRRPRLLTSADARAGASAVWHVVESRREPHGGAEEGGPPPALFYSAPSAAAPLLIIALRGHGEPLQRWPLRAAPPRGSAFAQRP